MRSGTESIGRKVSRLRFAKSVGNLGSQTLTGGFGPYARLIHSSAGKETLLVPRHIEGSGLMKEEQRAILDGRDK